MNKSLNKYPVDVDAIKEAKAIVLRCVDPRFSRTIRHYLRHIGLWPVFQLPRLGGINDLTSHRRLVCHTDSLSMDIHDSFEKVLDGSKLPFICIQHQQCRGCGQGHCTDEEECYRLQSRLVHEGQLELMNQAWFRESITEFRGHFFHLDGSVSDIELPISPPSLQLVA